MAVGCLAQCCSGLRTLQLIPGVAIDNIGLAPAIAHRHRRLLTSALADFVSICIRQHQRLLSLSASAYGSINACSPCQHRHMAASTSPSPSTSPVNKVIGGLGLVLSVADSGISAVDSRVTSLWRSAPLARRQLGRPQAVQMRMRVARSLTTFGDWLHRAGLAPRQPRSSPPASVSRHQSKH
jgi:hypothetical protein